MFLRWLRDSRMFRYWKGTNCWFIGIS
jgi:hypothetical protein